MNTYDVLAIGAHPDDVEVGCGGVLMKLRDAGRRVALTYLTKGEMGTGGTAEIREQEARAAAQIMGVDFLSPFDWGDSRLLDSIDRRVELAALIRNARPKIIFCPHPQNAHGRRQSHPDHVATGVLTVNAVQLAALKKLAGDGLPHYTDRVYHFFSPPQVAPSFVVDITAQYEGWMNALRAHTSQFQNPEKGRDYLFALETMVRAFGQQGRCKYGQGFFSFEPLLLDDLMDTVKVQDIVR